MSGIEHDKRARIAALRVRSVRARQVGADRLAVERDPAQETLAVGGLELEDHARRRTIGGIDDESLLDARGPGKVEDNARPALHHQPETEGFDQAAPAFACLRR